MVTIDKSMIINNFLNGYVDLLDTFKHPQKWLYLGYFDILCKYKRTILGPWWTTLSIAIVIFVLSFAWSNILEKDLNFFVVFFTIGYVFWTWFSANILEASAAFIEFDGIIRQIKIPINALILRISIRNLIMFFHNSLLIFLVVYYFGDEISYKSFFFISIPSLFLIFWTIHFISVLVSIVSIRYRDLQNVISYLMQLLFFFSPILWHPDILNNKILFLDFNYLYHALELLREPLLGKNYNSLSLYVIFFVLLVIFCFANFMVGKYCKKIYFWL